MFEWDTQLINDIIAFTSDWSTHYKTYAVHSLVQNKEWQDIVQSLVGLKCLNLLTCILLSADIMKKT